MYKSIKRFVTFLTLFYCLITLKAQENVIPDSKQLSAIPTTSNGDSLSTKNENKDKEQMEEVVVTALGIKREKKSLGYSVQEIKGDLVQEVKDGNFVNSLSGKVAGLDIARNNGMGASSNVIIRGFKSLNGNNQALFVVDGVPIDNTSTNTRDQVTGRGGYDYGNSAADINPDDIESISVLKGAAATALYGSRANNGVILIVTKKKNTKKGIGVTFSTSYSAGVFDPNTFIKYQKSYGAGYGNTYANTSNKFFDGSGANDLIVPLSEDASWGAKFDASKQVSTWSTFVPGSPNYGKKSSWTAAANDPSSFFQTSNTLNNYIAIENGTDKGSYKLSYTNYYQSGIMPNSSISKNTVYVNASQELLKGLTASFVGNYVNQATTGRYVTGYNENLMSSFRQWWQTNVDIKELQDIYNSTKKNYTWNPTSSSDFTPIFWDNPYWTSYENYSSDSRNRFYGNTSLEYKIDEHWNALARVGFDVYSTLQEERTNIGSNQVAKYLRYNKNYSEFNYDGLVTYKNKFGQDFDFTGLIGTNIRVTNINTIQAETNGGMFYDRFYSLSNSKNALSPPTEVNTPIQVNGYFASTSLGYKDFVYLDLTGRVDQSSTLPVNNNTYFYPSASLGFIFSEFMKQQNLNQSWLSFGKLRLNYAMVGNSAPALSVLQTYSVLDPVTQTNNSSFNGVAFLAQSTTRNNADLKPEKTVSIELGLEMSFLKNRVGFDVALYKVNTLDQILPVATSLTTGYNYKYVNAGEIQNQGIEIQLNGKPIVMKDFEWNIVVNWNKNVNKVISLTDDATNFQLATYQGGVSLNATVGDAYGTIKGTDYNYAPDGQKIVDASGFYTKTSSSAITIGNLTPDWKGGIRNTFTYKDISFSFLIDVKWGGSIFSLDRYYGLATGLPAETAGNNELGNPLRDPIVKNSDGTYASNSGGVLNQGVVATTVSGVTTYKQNTVRGNTSAEGGYGSLGYSKLPAKAFIYDATYVKLREIALTYNLNKKFLPKFIQGASISLTARNVLILFKNMPDADPEEGITNGNSGGYQSGAYPTVREMGGKLTFKF